jgi:hypothetical protein
MNFVNAGSDLSLQLTARRDGESRRNCVLRVTRDPLSRFHALAKFTSSPLVRRPSVAIDCLGQDDCAGHAMVTGCEWPQQIANPCVE